MVVYNSPMITYAFIDAANLFYGGEKSLGWKIDYRKLAQYLKDKYQVTRILYFGGVEIHQFQYDYLEYETVPLEELNTYLLNLKKDIETSLIQKYLQRIKFYRKLEQFGYELLLKPVKLYTQDRGDIKRKANCDVEMAFYMMKEKDNFDKALVLSGDGDFLPLLKYLRNTGKDVLILSRSDRTAREIRQFAQSNFRDFEYLKVRLKM